MELLPEYEVASDGEDFRRCLEGATEPTRTLLLSSSGT
jgi:hypothetical protein